MHKLVPLLGLVLALFACDQGPSTPQAVSVESAPALGPYSSAMVYDELVYLSGIVAFDAKTKQFAPANIEDQFAQAFANLQAVLDASGSDIAHVIKVTVYLKDPADFPRLNEIYAQAFAPSKPARTTVPGVNWGRDDVLIELDVIAAQK